MAEAVVLLLVIFTLGPPLLWLLGASLDWSAACHRESDEPSPAEQQPERKKG